MGRLQATTTTFYSHPHTATACAFYQAQTVHRQHDPHHDQLLAQEQTMPSKLRDSVSQELQTQALPDR